MARVDYTDRAKEYSRARKLAPAVLAPWCTVLAQIDFLPTRVVLDLGAGTGGFLEPLNEWFAAPVIAVEPSEAMRRESARAGLARRYPRVAARAESLPLQSESIDVAWLSTVIHQFDDRDTAARELRRLIRPGGRVLIRGFLSDVTITGLLSMFPGIERSADLFPSTDAVVSSFERAGLTLDGVTDVVEPWEFDLVADRASPKRSPHRLGPSPAHRHRIRQGRSSCHRNIQRHHRTDPKRRHVATCRTPGVAPPTRGFGITGIGCTRRWPPRTVGAPISTTLSLRSVSNGPTLTPHRVPRHR